MKLKSILVAVIMAISSVGIVSALSQKDNVQVELNKLMIAMQDSPKGLNPITVSDVWSVHVVYQMFESTLVREPYTLEIKPWIIYHWDVSPDYKELTAYYRLGKYNYVAGSKEPVLKFHNGREVTIDDVIFSFSLGMQQPRWSPGFDAFDKTPNGTLNNDGITKLIKGIAKIDDHTIKFKLNRTEAQYEALMSMTIFPYKEWVAHYTTILEWDMGYNPDTGECPMLIGCGPFEFKLWDRPGGFAEVETYKDYFPWNKMPTDKDGNPPPQLVGKKWYWEERIDPDTGERWGDRPARPLIDGIQFKIYTNVHTGIMALDKGEVDFLWWMIDPGAIAKLSANPNIGFATHAERGFFYVAFNMREDRPFGYKDGVDRGVLFRRAFAHCVNKQEIVSRLLQNYGRTGKSVVAETDTFWYNDSVVVYPYDLEKAKELLNKAGIVDKDGDGWRELPDWGDKEIEFIHPTSDYDSIRFESGRMITETLRNLDGPSKGINIVSRPTDFGQIVKRIGTRDFDIYMLGWAIGGVEPAYMYSFYHSSQATRGNNYAGYKNKSFDATIEQARSELDINKRRELYKCCQGILSIDVPNIVLYYRDSVEGYRKDRFVGWKELSGGIASFWSFLFMHPPSKQMLVLLNHQRAVSSEGDAQVQVVVKDKEAGIPLSGVKVNLTTAPLQGKFAQPVGNTDSSGSYVTTYKAPKVDNDTEIIIYARATTKGYDPTTAQSSIPLTVVPGYVNFLVAEISTTSELLDSDEEAVITVKVTDKKRNPISGCVVSISVNPVQDMRLDNESGITDATGQVTFRFSARIPEEEKEERREYSIIATPSKEGYNKIFEDVISIFVKRATKPPAPALNLVGIFGCVLSAYVLTIVFAKRKGKGKIDRYNYKYR